MSMLLLTMGPNLSIMADIPTVGVGSPGVIRFRPIGAIGPVKWTLVDSTLPAEWDSALNPDGNAVTLTTADAETAGTFSVTVSAVDSARIPVVRSFEVRVMVLPLTISGAFPEWEVGQPVSGSLTISGGVQPYGGLAITAGALPAGVSLSIVGNQIVPSGSPTVAGPWSATVQVSDSLSTTAMTVVSGDVTVMTDPYWEQVVALLHFDGPDGSTTFTDQKGRAWSRTRTAQIDTAQSKFGGSSLYLDGVSASIYTGDSDDLEFGSGAFTEEAWIRFNATTGEQGIFSKFDGALRGHVIRYSASNGGIRAVFGSASGAYDAINASWSPSTGAWYHFAVSRSGNTVRIFVDGSVIGTLTLANAAAIGGNSEFFVLGFAQTVTDSEFNGWMDDVRITKGVARYTANVTPPDRAFPDQ